MKPTITAFRNNPDRGKGLGRDMRVRWALEEVGQPYDVRLATFEELKQPAHLALSPFGQIPTYEQGDLVMFESGAILLHLAEQHPGLLPTDPTARARAITWLFCAISTIEPLMIDRSNAVIGEAKQPWAAARLPLVDQRIRDRLGQLVTRFGASEWLESEFTVGDLMMISVLYRLCPSGMLNEFPTLAAYVARGEARPAYKRAFAAQYQVFLESQR